MEVEAPTLLIQDYFKSIGRVPTETELKVLDTCTGLTIAVSTFETWG